MKLMHKIYFLIGILLCMLDTTYSMENHQDVSPVSLFSDKNTNKKTCGWKGCKHQDAPQLLLKHWGDTHKNDVENLQSYTCHVKGCKSKKQFKTISNLERHLRNNHFQERLRCTQPGCEKDFKSKYDLIVHLKAKKHRWSEEAGSSVEKLYGPMKNDAIEKICGWNACPEQGISEEIMDHWITEHRSGVKNNKNYRCCITGCNKEFKRIRLLERHLKSNKHFNVCSFTCGQLKADNKTRCNDVFTQKESLLSHFKSKLHNFSSEKLQKIVANLSKNKKENLVINEDDNGSGSQESAGIDKSACEDDNVQEDGDGNAHTCKWMLKKGICGFMGASNKDLHKHLLAHTRTSASFICQWDGCNKDFSKTGLLNNNLRSHISAHSKIYTCKDNSLIEKVCGWQGCPHKGAPEDVMQHWINKHRRQIEQTKNYKCHIGKCFIKKKTFTNMKNLEDHLKTTLHFDAYPLICEEKINDETFCKKRFKNWRRLLEHLVGKDHRYSKSDAQEIIKRVESDKNKQKKSTLQVNNKKNSQKKNEKSRKKSNPEEEEPVLIDEGAFLDDSEYANDHNIFAPIEDISVERQISYPYLDRENDSFFKTDEDQFFKFDENDLKFFNDCPESSLQKVTTIEDLPPAEKYKFSESEELDTFYKDLISDNQGSENAHNFSAPIENSQEINQVIETLQHLKEQQLDDLLSNIYWGFLKAAEHQGLDIAKIHVLFTQKGIMPPLQN